MTKFKIIIFSLLSCTLSGMHDVRVQMPSKAEILFILAQDTINFDDPNDNGEIAEILGSNVATKKELERRIFNVFGRIKRGSGWSVEYSNMVDDLIQSATDVCFNNNRTRDGFNR